jgi:predicted secreted protein
VKWTSILAIYALFWVFSAFLLLPFGVRTHEEADLEKVPGQADSAPATFRPGQLMARATLLSVLLCGLYVLNYTQGWITAEDLNLFGEPPAGVDYRKIDRPA